MSLVLALAGCTTVGPDFVQPKAPLPEQWQQTDSAMLTRKPDEQIRWWEAFGDPVLGKLVEIAYQNNYNLKIAGLRVLEARAQLGIAVGTLYPQVQQAVGGATYTSASENAANTAAGDLRFWEYNVGASVGWELDFWGKFQRGIESADANLLASIAAYDNALVLLVAQVADTYVVIRSAEEQLQGRARKRRPPAAQPFRSPRPGFAAAMSESSTCCRRAPSCWARRRRSRRWRPGCSRQRTRSARCWAAPRATWRRFWARSRA